ncbi:hypothetical protein [Nostoc sp.]|uniref:hypothetical protein n=1 Tax=Nostoc sp. TaxID=1180 RepID=UPI002FFAAD05
MLNPYRESGVVVTLLLKLSKHSQRISVCISGGNLGLVIDDSLIYYLFSNLKRKSCSERTLPNRAIEAIASSTTVWGQS